MYSLLGRIETVQKSSTLPMRFKISPTLPSCRRMTRVVGQLCNRTYLLMPQYSARLSRVYNHICRIEDGRIERSGKFSKGEQEFVKVRRIFSRSLIVRSSRLASVIGQLLVEYYSGVVGRGVSTKLAQHQKNIINVSDLFVQDYLMFFSKRPIQFYTADIFD